MEIIFKYISGLKLQVFGEKIESEEKTTVEVRES